LPKEDRVLLSEASLSNQQVPYENRNIQSYLIYMDQAEARAAQWKVLTYLGKECVFLNRPVQK
jgi:hypothetical protein